MELYPGSGLRVGYILDLRAASMERQAVTGQPITETCADDVLVSAARAGDRSAFGLLYDRYARMVHGILLCRVPPRDVGVLVPAACLLWPLQTRSLRAI